MREAIALVRKELGPGAAVLHSREIRRNALGKMLYGTGVEVTASPQLPASMRRKPMPPVPSEREVEINVTNAAENEPAKQGSRKEEPKKFAPINRIKQIEASQVEEVQFEQEQQKTEPMKTGFPLLDSALPCSAASSSGPPDSVPPNTVLPDSGPPSSEPTENLGNQAIFDKLEERLSETDLSAELIETLCKQASIDFEHADEIDLDILIEHAVQSLSAQLLIADPISIETSEAQDEAEARDQAESSKRPKMIALVGPTGVGKTTTIAKLAATLSVTQGYRVGLITLDSYRVAAIEQLRTYAGLLGLPVEVAGNAEEIRAAMQAMQGLDLVLIDTDGRSPRDTAAIEHMKSLLDELAVDETHLVLAASTSQRGLAEAIRAFHQVNPTQLLLTKIDETPTLGHIVKTSHDAKLSIGYLTDGQGVPEDLAIAEAESFARSILGA